MKTVFAQRIERQGKHFLRWSKLRMYWETFLCNNLKTDYYVIGD